jgi:hypothetical protein
MKNNSNRVRITIIVGGMLVVLILLSIFSLYEYKKISNYSEDLIYQSNSHIRINEINTAFQKLYQSALKLLIIQNREQKIEVAKEMDELYKTYFDDVAKFEQIVTNNEVKKQFEEYLAETQRNFEYYRKFTDLVINSGIDNSINVLSEIQYQFAKTEELRIRMFEYLEKQSEDNYLSLLKLNQSAKTNLLLSNILGFIIFIVLGYFLKSPMKENFNSKAINPDANDSTGLKRDIMENRNEEIEKLTGLFKQMLAIIYNKPFLE